MTGWLEQGGLLEEWGWDSGWSQTWSQGQYPGEPARVVAVDRGSLQLQSARRSGRGVLGRGAGAPAAEALPTVGDWCAVTLPESADLWRIHARLPRRTSLIRRAAGRATLAQELAANVDTVFLLCALDRDQGLRSLERLLALVFDGGATPVIVLNKVDQCPDLEDALLSAGRAAPGIPVVPVSALTGQGLANLDRFLSRGATVALLGPSGSGKSTLVNALTARADSVAQRPPVAATGPVREGDRRGRHTTTRRQLHPLPGAGLVLDTPGLRELGCWVEPDDLRRAFADIDSLAGACRFSNCRHDQEPGCAVRQALLDGELEPGRFHRFLELADEALLLQARRDQRGRLEAKRQGKVLSKEIRRYNRGRDKP